MGLVEAITSEFFQQIKDLIRFPGWDLVQPGATLHKNFPLLGHFLRLLFAHRAAEQIRRSQRKSSEHLRCLHHLFLVHHDAIGFAANRFQQRVFVFDFHLSVTPANKLGDQLHRPRPIECDQCGNVLDRTDLEFAAQISHAA